MAKRPMWLVCHTALKVPSGAIVADTVPAQVQLVWWPERWIWIVSPASCDGAVPEKVSSLPRMPEAVVCSVMPLPVVATVTFPLPTLGAGPVVVVPVPVVVVTGDPPGSTPAPPPDDASAAAGTASAAVSRADTA